MTPRSRLALIQQMTGFPILVRPKGFRLPVSDSARRALARELGFSPCMTCGSATVFGADPGVDVLVCAPCRELKKRADELPPAA